MTSIIKGEELLQHPFTKCVFDAFSHLEFVHDTKRTNNYKALLEGYPLTAFAESGMSFEEYFVRNLFKKVSNVVVDGVDPEKNTINKFNRFLIEQEETSMRVTALLEQIDNTTSIGRVLLNCRKMFHDIFSSFNEFELRPRFTSGSTLSLNKVQGVSPFSRFKASEGSKHLRAVFEKRRAEGVYRFSVTDQAFPQTEGTDDFYTQILMVPKQWDTLRIIGNNPSSPLACQAGLGDWMTYRAKTRIGIDISTAQAKHKQLARLASLVDSYLMTADQSEASDRILRVFVAWLMPSDVFEYMLDITPSTIQMPDGTRMHTHMMAPAGNGYIFPLQTILFWALTHCTCKEIGIRPEVYSYGDDLIAPAAVYTQLERVFNLLGLKMNPNKTFRDGSTRESCGGDYVLGSDVRPLYVKSVPTTNTEWYTVLNGIRRVGYDNNANCWRTNNFRRLWLWCLLHLQPKDRLFAPIHYGDTAIGTCDSRLYRLTYRRKYFDGEKFTAYPNGGLKDGVPYSGWYITICATKSAGKGETFPEHTKGVKLRNLLRLTSLDSVQGAGDNLKIFKTDRQGVLLKEPLVKYVYSPFFHRDELVIQKITVPFFAESPAPSDDMDSLFSLLCENNPIIDSAAVIQRGNTRWDNAVNQLMDIIRGRILQLEAVHADIKSMDLNF